MIDGVGKRMIEPAMARAARQLVALGFTADQVTLAGFALALTAAVLIATGNLVAGLAVIVASRICDGLDGAIAREVGVSDFGGYLDIVLRYYENEILEGSESQFSTSSLDNEPFAEIVLLEDVAYFEWRVLDGRSLEWSYDWDIQGRLPLQMELVMAIGAKGEEIRRVFWIPPKQNPEIVMRQMAQTGGNNENGGGALNIDLNTPGGGADPDGGGRGPGGRGDGGRGGRGGPPPGGGGRPPGR